MPADYPDGVWLVELAPLADPELVPQTRGHGAGRARAAGPAADRQTLSPRTGHDQHLLLVLDNCEHLLDACAALAERCCARCPRVRDAGDQPRGARHRRRGDLARALAGAARPATQAPPPQVLAPYEAVRLFVERARRARRTSPSRDQNAPAVAEVCRRLDGIPLALELAAARVRSLTVEQIAARLDDRFRLLTGGRRTALPRQQTLRAPIDWSYDLLTEPERALLRRLAVFAGGWTLEAAEAVCAGDGVEAGAVLDLLTRWSTSRWWWPRSATGEARYRLLETVRQYARERLLEQATARRCATGTRLVPGAGRAGRGRLLGARAGCVAARLEAEHDNLRAALEWSLVRRRGGSGKRPAAVRPRCNGSG